MVAHLPEITISRIASTEWGLIVPAGSSIESPADLIEQAKANAGKLTYSSGGVGSPQHIAMAMFLSKAGAQMMHVPYKGATPGAIAVAAGEVEAGFQGLAAALGLVLQDEAVAAQLIASGLTPRGSSAQAPSRWSPPNWGPALSYLGIPSLAEVQKFPSTITIAKKA